MMRRMSGLLFFVLVLFSLGACKDSDPVPIVSIDIEETSIAEFYHMDDFDLGQIEVILEHEDGSSTRVPLDDSMLTGDDLALLETTGTHTITVYHATHEITVTIVIIETGATEQTILFETGEGTPIEPLVAYSGTQVVAPSDPQREGYTFNGWFADESFATPFLFDVMPEEGLTLFAMWIPNEYEVTFDGQGTEYGVLLNGIDVTYDQPYGALPFPIRTGYTFLGWLRDTGDDVFVDEDYVVDTAEDHILLAIWQINQYTITFNSNEGSPVDPIIQDYATEVIEPASPERLGYTFDGWFANPQMTVPYAFETMPAGDMTLHAKWQINPYTITFDSNGGSDLPSMTRDYNTVVSEPEEPVREGYTFAGWYGDEHFNDMYVFDRMPAEDITVYALWHNTISFESNGGSYVPAIIMRAGEETREPETPTKEAHTFIAWFIDEELTEEFVFSVMPEPDITLYAKWELNQYTVTFETNGGESWDSVTLDYGTPFADYQPSREGYFFMGWYLEDTFDTEILSVPARDLTVYARWFDVPMVLVGEQGNYYTIPTEFDDSELTSVEGGYLMATTETTYELWYEVRIWAEENGYHIQNQGSEGNEGTTGAAPNDHGLQPVTNVSWRDTIVWLNAASEMSGYDPVYRTEGGDIIRDSRSSNGSVVDAAIQSDHNGYRLPTSNEWEMAARWRNSGGDGSIGVEGRYWTPGNYASGATADYSNSSATGMVAWYYGNSGNTTHPVGEKTPNHLGLYDMSGNVIEWTYAFSPDGSSRIIRGGSCYDAGDVQVGRMGYSYPYSYMGRGFRMVRGQ